MASHLERCLFPGKVTGGEEGENWWFNIILNTVVLVILISFFSPAVILLTV